MFGEMSWDTGAMGPWIVGSASRDCRTPNCNRGQQMSSANGVVHNAKNIRWGINAENFNNADGTPNPREVPVTDTSLGSNHTNGANVAMTDGSAFFVRDDVDVDVLRRMASRASDDVYDRP
jgi:prepilin-type processing-associated H-X9-DG protein